MSHSIKAAYGNSPRATVAFVVPPPRCFIPLRRRLLLVYVCGPTHCQPKPNLVSPAKRWTPLLWRWRDCDFAICHLDDAASFFEKRSVPTVRFRRNAGSVHWNIVLSFYGRKMQPIQSRAIILNTLLLRPTLNKDEAYTRTPIPPQRVNEWCVPSAEPFQCFVRSWRACCALCVVNAGQRRAKCSRKYLEDM